MFQKKKVSNQRTTLNKGQNIKFKCLNITNILNSIFRIVLNILNSE